jgi:hypothetical protein
MSDLQDQGKRAASVLAIAFAVGAGIAQAAGVFEMHNPTIAGGGGIVSADCYALVGTIGEPVAGPTAAGPYELNSGFPATLGYGAGTPPIPVGDAIFGNGFEGNGGCE